MRALHIISRVILAAVLGIAIRAEAEGPSIEASISQLPNSRGVVRCALFASERGFPDEPKQASAWAIVNIVGNKALCKFVGIKPGVYALSFFHDENNNKQLDTNWLGMPEEAYGASNNPEPRLGPPRFAPARFVYRGGHGRLRVKPIE